MPTLYSYASPRRHVFDLHGTDIRLVDIYRILASAANILCFPYWATFRSLIPELGEWSEESGCFELCCGGVADSGKTVAERRSQSKGEHVMYETPRAGQELISHILLFFILCSSSADCNQSRRWELRYSHDHFAILRLPNPAISHFLPRCRRQGQACLVQSDGSSCI